MFVFFGGFCFDYLALNHGDVIVDRCDITKLSENHPMKVKIIQIGNTSAKNNHEKQKSQRDSFPLLSRHHEDHILLHKIMILSRKLVTTYITTPFNMTLRRWMSSSSATASALKLHVERIQPYDGRSNNPSIQ